MSRRHNKHFEQMGTEGDVVWVGPVNILLHNVQRWVAYRIVGGKVPENNRKKKYFPSNYFPNRYNFLKFISQSIKAYMAG
jgi:hypothetical protein